MLALDVLATIPVEFEHPSGYDRDRFRYGDIVDDHGCRTRALVLMRDSLTPAQVDAGGCAVVAGDWYSRYDGATWTDPAELEIDHVVALKEAWDSGGWAWDDARLTAFGNDVDDVRSLVAVTGAENQAKRQGPVQLGSVERRRRVHLRRRLDRSRPDGACRWTSRSTVDPDLLTDRCPGQTIAPWAPVPAISAPTAEPAVTAPPTPAVAPVPRFHPWLHRPATAIRRTRRCASRSAAPTSTAATSATAASQSSRPIRTGSTAPTTTASAARAESAAAAGQETAERSRTR